MMFKNLFARVKKPETRKTKSVLQKVLQDAVCILAVPVVAFAWVALKENDPLSSPKLPSVHLEPSGVKKVIAKGAKGICGDPRTPQTSFLANCVTPTSDRESREAFAQKFTTAVRVDAIRDSLRSNGLQHNR